MTIVKFRRGRRQPAAPSNEKATCSYRAILVFSQGLHKPPTILPIADNDVEAELVMQRVGEVLKGGS